MVITQVFEDVLLSLRSVGGTGMPVGANSKNAMVPLATVNTRNT